MTNELLQLTPDHERARGNKVFYEKEIAELKAESKVKGDDGSESTPVSDLVSTLFFNRRKLTNCFYKSFPTPHYCSPSAKVIQAYTLSTSANPMKCFVVAN